MNDDVKTALNLAAPAAPATPSSSSPFFEYAASAISAPEHAPRCALIPIETIGYWFSDLANHGPIVRFWSFNTSSKLVSFISWNALVTNGAEVFKLLRLHGAPIRRLDGSASSQLQLAAWIHDLQADAIDARILAGFGQMIVTPLPAGISPPEVAATLRPEATAPEWLSAPANTDIHGKFAQEQYALALQSARDGAKLH